MTIIANDMDAGSEGIGYTTRAELEDVAVRQNVFITGFSGIVAGKDASGVYYASDTIFNSGNIDVYDVGVSINGANSRLFNGEGGTLDAVYGVLSSGSGVHVDNNGDIDASATAIMLAGSGSTIINAGRIHGVSDAVSLEGSASSLRNTGSIVGDVLFGSGSNVFDGRGGTLNGSIDGGSDADTVRLGSDGETVRGGDGADTIYAGAGADTVVLTHLSAGDVDTIRHFDAGQDTLELEHGSFSQLVAGHAVVVADAAKATSAADRLFYNPASGVLFYDADGSGTKSAARAVADLDPGLHLTAKSFDVV